MSGVNIEHANSYWRTVFERSSNGRFTKGDLDKWFRSKAGPNPSPLAHIGVPDRFGTPEHFDMIMRSSLHTMLEACAKGQFSQQR
jgi:hypothetical protein